jgi:hypothetical protein
LGTIEEALKDLADDPDFMLKGGVFTPKVTKEVGFPPPLPVCGI